MPVLGDEDSVRPPSDAQEAFSLGPRSGSLFFASGASGGGVKYSAQQGEVSASNTEGATGTSNSSPRNPPGLVGSATRGRPHDSPNRQQTGSTWRQPSLPTRNTPHRVGRKPSTGEVVPSSTQVSVDRTAAGSDAALQYSESTLLLIGRETAADQSPDAQRAMLPSDMQSGLRHLEGMIEAREKQDQEEGEVGGNSSVTNHGSTQPVSTPTEKHISTFKTKKLHKAANPWQMLPGMQAQNEVILRTIQGMLNKITPETFSRLSDEIVRQMQKLATEKDYSSGVRQVFDTALREPKFSKLLSDLCVKLAAPGARHDTLPEKVTFRRILLNLCHDEFSKLPTLQIESSGLDEDDILAKLWQRQIGNIQFIGQLFEHRLIPEAIVIEVIKELVAVMSSVSANATNEKAKRAARACELVCRLLSAVGRSLDESSRSNMDAWFAQFATFLSLKDVFPPRVRFFFLDLEELRTKLAWVPRASKRERDSGPKTLAEIAAEVNQRALVAQIDPSIAAQAGGGAMAADTLVAFQPPPNAIAEALDAAKVAHIASVQPPVGVGRPGTTENDVNSVNEAVHLEVCPSVEAVRPATVVPVAQTEGVEKGGAEHEEKFALPGDETHNLPGPGNFSRHQQEQVEFWQAVERYEEHLPELAVTDVEEIMWAFFENDGFDYREMIDSLSDVLSQFPRESALELACVGSAAIDAAARFALQNGEIAQAEFVELVRRLLTPPGFRQTAPLVLPQVVRAVFLRIFDYLHGKDNPPITRWAEKLGPLVPGMPERKKEGGT